MHQPFTATARHTPPHSSAFVQMHSGFCVDLLAPDLTGLTLTDIATHLARLPRFNGATRGPRPYSVAQHSVLVSQILEQAQHNRLIQIAGLLHDAHEALMGDITTPTKIALGREPRARQLPEPRQPPGASMMLRTVILPALGGILFAGLMLLPLFALEILEAMTP